MGEVGGIVFGVGGVGGGLGVVYLAFEGEAEG